jgi:hypothetical protein
MNKTDKVNYLKIFNDHFIDFIDDIIHIFPNDIELLATKNAFILMRQTNPKLIINVFNTYVVSDYKNEIQNGDIDYFLNKDYTEDLKTMQYSSKILDKIDKLRTPIKLMKSDDKEKIIKYLQNLQKLSELYLSLQ